MGRPLTITKVVNWKRQFYKTEKIAEEPSLNRKGFWKKPDFPHVTDKKASLK